MPLSKQANGGDCELVSYEPRKTKMETMDITGLDTTIGAQKTHLDAPLPSKLLNALTDKPTDEDTEDRWGSGGSISLLSIITALVRLLEHLHHFWAAAWSSWHFAHLAASSKLVKPQGAKPQACQLIGTIFVADELTRVEC